MKRRDDIRDITPKANVVLDEHITTGLLIIARIIARVHLKKHNPDADTKTNTLQETNHNNDVSLPEASNGQTES
ncbi:MAG: hypothetical protein JW967_10775 [Dehalococcoidales bacterium]|nr:hypothetical protein [Dehalococcoidales bacterium]